MRSGQVTQVDCPMTWLADIKSELSTMVAGKICLNVGAVGGIQGYLPYHREEWLHEILRRQAASIRGIDIDSASIQYAHAHGESLELADCTDWSSDE